MKVIGIYPQVIVNESIITRSTAGEPIGLGIMLSIAESLGNMVQYVPAVKSDLADLDKEIHDFDPDICLLSIMTSQFNLAKEIALRIKSWKPATIVVGGGYHPSSGMDVAYPFDLFIKGEGEIVLRKLLIAIASNESYSSISGLSYLEGGKVIKNPKSERKNLLRNYIKPYRSQKSLSQKYYGLVYPDSNYQKSFAYIEYGRGCYYDCSYCCKQSIFQDNKVYYRDPKDVVQEIEYLIYRYNTNLLFFTDLNFTANDKKVKELCHHIINNKIEISWFCMSNLQTARKETLLLMKEAGCVKIMYGVESVSDKLQSMTRKNRVSSYSILRETAEVGILTHIFYVVGFPWETLASLENSSDLINEIPAHQLRISVATPLPGSQWSSDVKNKGLTSNLDLYDTEHITFTKAKYSQKQLDDRILQIYRNFYLSSDYIKRVQKLLEVKTKFRKSFIHFFSELHRQKVINDDEHLRFRKQIKNCASELRSINM